MASKKPEENELRTRCPECQTVLKVNRDQLARRNGVARCGRCATVFLAERYAIEPSAAPPKQAARPAADTRRQKIDKPSATPKRAAPREEVAPVGEPITTTPRTAEEMLEEARRSLFGSPAARTRPLFWALGVTLLTVLLIGQIAYYNRTELARYPSIKPAILAFCRALNCEIAPRRNVALIELSQSTIAPHPSVKNTLRIRTSMVNRATFSQPFPLLEVSLTDSGGQLLARRSFTAEDYLPAPDKWGREMPANVLVRGLLDITNPDNKAVGYELRLVTP